MATYPHIIGDQERPTSVHAEMTILGAMLVEPVAIIDATMLLKTDDFALDSHRKIYAAMLQLVEFGHGVDIVTITDHLSKKKELDSVGGLPYLASLSEGLPRKLSIESYVRIVRDKSLARGLMNVAERGALEAGDGQEEAAVVLDRTIQELRELADSAPGNDLQRVDAILEAQGPAEAMVERMATLNGIRIGFEQVDNNTHGLQPKHLVVVAARPS